MPKFMILIYETAATSGKLGPEETQKVYEKYAAWAKSLQRRELGLLMACAGGPPALHEDADE